MLSAGISGASIIQAPFTTQTPIRYDTATNSLQSAIFYKGSFIVFPGAQNRQSYYRSSDLGDTWSLQNLPINTSWGQVQDLGNYLISAAGFNASTAYISFDGLSWQATNLPIAGYYWQFVQLSNGNTIGLSKNGVNVVIVSSNNNITSWSSGVHPEPAWTEMVSDGTYAYLLSNTRKIYRSLNGSSWTQVGTSPVSGTFYYLNGHFIIISGTSLYVSTNDLSKWYQIRTPQAIYKMAFDPVNKVYVSTTYSDESLFMSRNLDDWQTISLQTIANHNEWNALAAYAGSVIAAPYYETKFSPEFESFIEDFSNRIYKVQYSPPPIGQSLFESSGTWTAPDGVTSVSVVAIGGGGGGLWSNLGSGSAGGGGGGLAWKNNIPVTPGQSYSVVVGAGGLSDTNGGSTITATNGGSSYFNTLLTVGALGGSAATSHGSITPPNGGDYFGGNGGVGGSGGRDDLGTSTGQQASGGGGAGGYSGNGGNGGSSFDKGEQDGTAGLGGAGGGGGGAGSNSTAGSGGGVGVFGQGASGELGGGGTTNGDGAGGFGGSDGTNANRPFSGTPPEDLYSSTLKNTPGLYGGGAGGSVNQTGGEQSNGAQGAVRIIWGSNRAFPSTNTGDM